MKIRHALVMAAGRGQRMGPLTDVVPKPMAPYEGSTLIAKGIQNIRRDVPSIHITVGYKKAMLAEHVIHQGVSSVLNTEGQTNSWWIYNTLMKFVNEPVYVLTADNVTDLDFELLERNYFDLNEPAAMIVPVYPVQGLEGDYITQENRYVTKLDRSKPTTIYCSGIQIINPARVNVLAPEQGDFYLLWHQLMEQRQLMVSEVYPKKWISIDTFEQLMAATKPNEGQSA